MALWIAISSIGQKEHEELCFSNDMVHRGCVPQDMIIEIGKSRFSGQLVEGDHIIMIDDSRFNETINANKAYHEGYHAGETNGILTAKRKHYKGKTYDEIWKEAYAEGQKNIRESMIDCLGLNSHGLEAEDGDEDD